MLDQQFQATQCLLSLREINNFGGISRLAIVYNNSYQPCHIHILIGEYNI